MIHMPVERCWYRGFLYLRQEPCIGGQMGSGRYHKESHLRIIHSIKNKSLQLFSITSLQIIVTFNKKLPENILFPGDLQVSVKCFCFHRNKLQLQSSQFSSRGQTLENIILLFYYTFPSSYYLHKMYVLLYVLRMLNPKSTRCWR